MSVLIVLHLGVELCDTALEGQIIKFIGIFEAILELEVSPVIFLGVFPEVEPKLEVFLHHLLIVNQLKGIVVNFQDPVLRVLVARETGSQQAIIYHFTGVGC